jgi:hypothetical protein
MAISDLDANGRLERAMGITSGAGRDLAAAASYSLAGKRAGAQPSPPYRRYLS